VVPGIILCLTLTAVLNNLPPVNRNQAPCRIRLATRLAIVLGLLCSAVAATAAATFNTVYSFTSGSDGMFPMAPLMQASDGALYGAANWGGAIPFLSGYGTVFKLTLDGTFTTLYQFENNGDGDHPNFSGLAEDADGYLYGTTGRACLPGHGITWAPQSLPQTQSCPSSIRLLSQQPDTTALCGSESERHAFASGLPPRRRTLCSL
jgi:uncharacterized repeat protein (TIGR03803 family)